MSTDAPKPPIQQSSAWDKTAQDYDEMEKKSDLLGGMARAAFDAFVAEGKSKTDLRLLDSACGSGVLTVYAAKNLPNAKINSIDFSSGMIEALNKNIQQANLTNVEASVMDGMKLEFPDATFDYVCSSFGLIFFPDPVKALAEVMRVLKPGGRFVMTTWDSSTGAMTIFKEAMRKFIPGQEPRPFLGPFTTRDSFEATLKAAGFKDTEIRPVETNTNPITYDDFLPSVKSNPGFQKFVGNENYGKDFIEVVKEVMQELHPIEPFQIHNLAMIGTGIKPQ
eukprot:TRINITY_DN3113_c0_g2_i1.p1 TRINITY_DN3113_c0_g2~~TRINITY_DN3113_c0_g2_i1.p1  ORF type:complete len:279 (+),score=69.62 TRINITY_DN3113_c0_g2_i1:645-1481(+)